MKDNSQSRMNMSYDRLVAHAYGQHSPPKRTWNELTLQEVIDAYDKNIRYQTEDTGARRLVDFAAEIERILKEKNT